MARGRRTKREAVVESSATEPGPGVVEVIAAHEMPAPPVVAEAPADPLAPVRVRNLGARGWSGSDWKRYGAGHIPAGGEGVVTRRKADELIAGKHFGAGAGVGPFEIVED